MAAEVPLARPLSTLFGLFSRDLGIDLGTANTLVYVRGKGIVISEPSVVAIDTKTRRAFGVGVEAKAMVGKTPESIIAVLPINEPVGSMIVDIGGGTTEVAVISLGGIVVNHSIRVAGDEIDDAIIQYARRDHNLVIGERTAENAKIAAGSAYPLEEEIRATLRGRDLLTGLPKSVEVSSVELRDAISQPVNTIVEVVKTAIEETPPELVADIMEQGITLAGGGALLFGLDRRLQTELKMPVYRADDPLTCVARGTGRVAEALHLYERALASGSEIRRAR